MWKQWDKPVSLKSLQKAGIVCPHLLSADFLCITSAQSLATEAGVMRASDRDETPVMAPSGGPSITSTDTAYSG